MNGKSVYRVQHLLTRKATAIYRVKIWLLQSHFKLTIRKMNKLRNMNIFQKFILSLNGFWHLLLRKQPDMI